MSELADTMKNRISVYNNSVELACGEWIFIGIDSDGFMGFFKIKMELDKRNREMPMIDTKTQTVILDAPIKTKMLDRISLVAYLNETYDGEIDEKSYNNVVHGRNSHLFFNAPFLNKLNSDKWYKGVYHHDGMDYNITGMYGPKLTDAIFGLQYINKVIRD